MNYSTHYLILLVTLLAQTCFGQEELFLQANKLYREQNYTDALARYQTIKNKGAAVWYNMGNCSFKLNNDLDALVYWRRARKGASVEQRQAIDHNINTLSEKIGRQDLYEKSTWYRSMVNRITALSWMVLQLLFLSIWYLAWLIVRSKRSKIRYALVGCCLMLNATLFVIKNNDQQKTGLITLDKALLYTGPQENYLQVGSLPSMTHVAIETRDGVWYKVRHQKNSGWVKDDALALV
jgi:hypothetical protein